MDPENKANLQKLLAEIRKIEIRLREISDAAYGDMEGADMPDFAISDELASGLRTAAHVVEATVVAVEKLIPA